jgi:hypothetical protein
MRPYFEYIEGINFEEDTRTKLSSYVMNNLDLFERSGSKPTKKYGKYDWNWFLPRDHMPKHLMDELGKKFKIPVTYEILGQSSWTDGKIHVDRIIEGIPPRITLINFPIYPLEPELFGPTRFWKLTEGKYVDYDNAKFELQAEVDYTKKLPVIFNLQEYHNAVNLRDDHRFNAQFTTNLPFDEIISLYDSGDLF